MDPKFSFRFKMLVLYAACACSVMFIIFAGGSYYINTLQKANVKEAIALAQQEARRMSKEIIEMATAQQSSDLNDPSMRAGLKAITHVTVRMNQSIVWAGIVHPSGLRTIEESYKGEQIFSKYAPSADPQVSRIQRAGDPDLEIETRTEGEGIREINQPIEHEGKHIGQIVLKVTETPTFQRIQASSRNITEALMMGCLLLLTFLLVVFLVLWRLFSKQLDLQQNNARLDRMAYVGTLASGLAHEIRNPLSAMSVNLEVMREELAEAATESPGKASELALRVQREVLQLNSTLTSFLEFALPSREGFSEFSLKALLDELVELHSEQMRQVGITCEVQVPVHTDTAMTADRRMVHQALRNILVNAIQAVSQAVKKQIRIRLEVIGQDQFVVSISDTGSGITPENLPKIFDVFFSTRKGGSGFGLAITRKIIEEHGGRIRAENNSDRLGASFIVELPREAQTNDNAPRHPRRISRFFRASAP